MSRIVVTGQVPDAAIEKLRLEHEVDAWQTAAPGVQHVTGRPELPNGKRVVIPLVYGHLTIHPIRTVQH